MVEVFAAKRHYKFRFENLTEFRDFLLIFLHVKSTVGDVPLFLPNTYFNHIIELSLNNAMKTDDQKRKTSESIFNSQITEGNTPVNAIRRVVLKPDGTRVPVGSSTIAEDVEGEDEEHQDHPNAGHQMHLEARADVEASSEDDQPELPKMEPVILPPAPTPDSDDDKKGKKSKKDTKDAKDKKTKEPKKDPKKDAVDRGYNNEEVEKGKHMMSNPNFQANLEKLKTQFAKSKGIDTGAGLKLSQPKKPTLSLNPKTDPSNQTAEPQEKPKINPREERDLQESEVIAADYVPRDTPALPQQSVKLQNDSSLKSGLGDSKGTNLRTLAMQNRLSGDVAPASKLGTSDGPKLGGLKLGTSKPALDLKRDNQPESKVTAGSQVPAAKLGLKASQDDGEDDKEFQINREPLNKKASVQADANSSDWKVSENPKKFEATDVRGQSGNALTIKKPGLGKKSQLQQEQDDDHNNSWDEKNPFD